MLNMIDFHSFNQRPHFTQRAENPLSASFFNLAVFAGYQLVQTLIQKLSVFLQDDFGRISARLFVYSQLSLIHNWQRLRDCPTRPLEKGRIWNTPSRICRSESICVAVLKENRIAANRLSMSTGLSFDERFEDERVDNFREFLSV